MPPAVAPRVGYMPEARERAIAQPLPTQPSAATASIAKWSARRIDSKELGLACGYVLGRHFFGWEDLHYGFWRPDDVVDARHFREAQARFSEVLLAHLPAEATTVLDVGCGTGKVAEQLIERGHQVDCVSPGPFLTAFARERLRAAANFFECRFEDLDTTAHYDVVLFCESLQYVRLAESLRRAASLLNPGGRLIIADFFRTDAQGHSPLAGGHRLREFYREIATLPLVCRTDLDITRETAPTVKIINDVMMDAVRPIWGMTQHFLKANKPWLSRIIHWAFRRQLAKIEKKQFAGQNTPEAFARFKSYRLMVFERK
jgi:SAM-dependent methyltransferase